MDKLKYRFYLDKYKHEKLGTNCLTIYSDSDKADVINVTSNTCGIIKIPVTMEDL